MKCGNTGWMLPGLQFAGQHHQCSDISSCEAYVTVILEKSTQTYGDLLTYYNTVSVTGRSGSKRNKQERILAWCFQAGQPGANSSQQ